jgi:hypothetical protein
MHQAWVVAVDMGYGHPRAAFPFRDIAYEGMITANTGAMVDPDGRKQWVALQSPYESVSRVHKMPVVGQWLWRTYDRFQAIRPHYLFRDLSKPTFYAKSAFGHTPAVSGEEELEFLQATGRLLGKVPGESPDALKGLHAETWFGARETRPWREHCCNNPRSRGVSTQ